MIIAVLASACGPDVLERALIELGSACARARLSCSVSSSASVCEVSRRQCRPRPLVYAEGRPGCVIGRHRRACPRLHGVHRDCGLVLAVGARTPLEERVLELARTLAIDVRLVDAPGGIGGDRYG